MAEFLIDVESADLGRGGGPGPPGRADPAGRALPAAGRHLQPHDFGVYRNRDGALHGEEDGERKEVAGIEWSKVDHKDGTLHTAWLDGKPVLKMRPSKAAMVASASPRSAARLA